MGISNTEIVKQTLSHLQGSHPVHANMHLSEMMVSMNSCVKLLLYSHLGKFCPIFGTLIRVLHVINVRIFLFLLFFLILCRRKPND